VVDLAKQLPRANGRVEGEENGSARGVRARAAAPGEIRDQGETEWALERSGRGRLLPPGEGRGEGPDRRALARLLKRLDEERRAAVEQLRQVAYFHRQVVWLQERFPKAELANVPGLVKLVDRAAIEAADWSLTPGRYVGVAPPEVDEDFDFEQTLRDIHTELKGLIEEAAELAVRIERNLEALGA
jgi:hypothetical protein